MALSHSGLRLMMVACFVICFIVLFINTNVMLSMRSIVSRERLGSLFHEEMRHVIHDYRVLSSLSQQNRLQTLPEFHEKFDEFNNVVKSTLDENMDSVPFLFHKNFTPAYTLGSGRNKPVSVVIGIPSVKRSGVSYLHQTLHSLFQNIYPDKEDGITIVVFLAETDMEFVKAEARNIYGNFTREVHNGLLQVISPPSDIYPKFDLLPQTLGDPAERLKWRSKEVFDAAYLMFICRHKAKYYLMLEDDVIAAKGYISATENFAAKHENEPYVYLSLSGFNSIGKLFQTTEVPLWSSYLLSFYGSKPIDWLMGDFVRIKACHPEMGADNCVKKIAELRPQVQPGLFQHVGKKSSLTGKEQLIVDKKFSTIAVAPNNYKNPSAKVESSLRSHDQSSAESLYDDSGGMNQHYFIEGGKADDHITITFHEPQYITKILVKTGKSDGSSKFNEDDAIVEVVVSNVRFTNNNDFKPCSSFDRNGAVQCLFDKVQISIVRIRLLETRSEPTWIDLIYIK